MHAYLFLFAALATVAVHFATGDVTLVEPVTDAAYLLQIRQQRHAAGLSVQTTAPTAAKAVASATTATANTLMALDSNVDGRIDPTEVVAFASKRGLDPAVVRLDFSDLDTNGDGSLDSREIALALGDRDPPRASQGPPTLAPHFELSRLSSRSIAQATDGTNSTVVGDQGRSSSSSERNGAALVAEELRTHAVEEEEVRRLEEEMGALRDQASATERAAAEEAAKAADRAAAAESKRIAKEVQSLEARAMEAEERAAALRARAAAEDQAARDYAAAAEIGLQDAA